jgi:hypothetical protein
MPSIFKAMKSVSFLLCAFGVGYFAQPARGQQTTVSIVLTQAFTDTGLFITQGQTVTISTTGQLNWRPSGCPSGQSCISSPGGEACGLSDMAEPSFPCYSLIGAVGQGMPFEVGSSLTFTQQAASGELYLGVNDDFYSDNIGAWSSIISVE